MEGQPRTQGGESESHKPTEQSQPKWDYSPIYEPPQHQPHTQKIRDKPKTGYWSDKRWRTPQVVVNAVLAFLTLCILIVYACTLLQTKHQMVIDQRAWISLDIMQGVPAADQPFIINTVIKNTGKTFAKNTLSTQGYYFSTDKPDIKRIDTEFSKIRQNLDSVRYSSVLLAPGARYENTYVLNHGEKIDLESFDDIMQKRLFVYVLGRITYDDVFGGSHWLTYCMVFDADTKTFAAYKEFNDTGD
jgi:hypothetical protein